MYSFFGSSNIASWWACCASGCFRLGFVRFRRKVVVSHCSYYCLISAVPHLHYFFASVAWILTKVFIYSFDRLLMAIFLVWFYFRSQVRWCFILSTISVFFISFAWHGSSYLYYELIIFLGMNNCVLTL